MASRSTGAGTRFALPAAMKHTNHLHLSKATRREFCVQTCQTASLVTLAAMIEVCGGSATSPSSAVVKGPAPAALRQFPTRFANNVLTIIVA